MHTTAMKTTLSLLAIPLAIGSANLAQGATIYQIDVNDDDSIATQSGWTALNADHDTGAGSATASGMTFTVAGADGARNRNDPTIPAESNVLRDFVFAGASDTITVTMGSALAAGQWKLTMYAADADQGLSVHLLDLFNITTSSTTALGAYQESETGPANRIDRAVWTGSSTVTDVADDPFTFTADGASVYQFNIIENSSFDRIRLNGFILEQVPEPSSAALLGLGGLLIARRRRD